MGRSLATPISVGALAERLSITLPHSAEAARLITGVASLSHAAIGDITFFSDKKFAKVVASTSASAVIALPNATIPEGCVHLPHPQPHLAFANLLQQLFPYNANFTGRSPLSDVHPTAKINDVACPVFCAIGENSYVGANTILHPNVTIGRNVRIGRDCLIHAGVTIYDGVQLGDRCIVQSGAVIGSDGFGFQSSATGWIKVPQVGTVIIGDDVEIGANTCIDRGAIEDTVIGNGVKIDNLVQIAHNVRIGEHTAIAGCAGIAGSTTIGRRCMIGGDAKVVGHLEICDDVIISAATIISASIITPGRYTGVFPAVEHRDWIRIAATLRRGAVKRKTNDSGEN